LETDAEEHVLDSFVKIGDGIERRQEKVNTNNERDYPRRYDFDVCEHAETEEVDEVGYERTREKNDEKDKKEKTQHLKPNKMCRHSVTFGHSANHT
jgi:hypothetical protein